MKLAKAKERKRSTHFELLGGVSTDTLRSLREIAANADLPLERVFRDVVAIGLSVLGDPAESPYQSLIAFRNGLAAKQAELTDARQREPAVTPPADTGKREGDRSPLSGFDQEELAGLGTTPAGEDGSLAEGSGDVIIGPGQRPAEPADIELSSAVG